MTYYFGRQFHQWARSDSKTSPDWREYAAKCVAGYARSAQWDEPLTLERVLEGFSEVTGEAFDTSKTELFEQVADPSTNEVSRESSNFRDHNLLRLISEAWSSGKHIFVVYGSGHAIKLEPDLRKLVQE